MGLAVDDQRIDATADIIDRRVAGEPHVSGLWVDLDLAGSATVREYRIMHLVVGDYGDAVLELLRKLVSGGLFGEIEKIESAVGRARAEPAVAELNMVRNRSQDRRRHLLPPRHELGERLREQSCGVAHG